jgi:AcrR family transcriptional regulator
MARKYRQKRRAEREAETRKRIVDATVDLHGTLGPARTSISAIAERAGVERPTVYRHFPTLDALLGVCSAQHWADYPPPDPEPWLAINDPVARMRKGLGELYAYYAQHEQRIWVILRDLEEMPALRAFAAHRIAHRQRTRDVLLAVWPHRGLQQKLLVAALGHAVDFFTWRTLHRQGLSDEEAVELMLGLCTASVSDWEAF